MAKGKRYEVRPIEHDGQHRWVVWDTLIDNPASWYYRDRGFAEDACDSMNKGDW